MKSTRHGIPLTPRELQVLRAVCAGYESKEVAQRLGIALRTVETHRANYRRKLTPNFERWTAEQIAVIAERQGLLKGLEVGAS